MVLGDQDDRGIGHPLHPRTLPANTCFFRAATPGSRLRRHATSVAGPTQPGLRTVEGELSTALVTVLRIPSVALTCAGRTDAGVHARGQVVHLDVDELPEGPARLLRRLNGILATRPAGAAGGGDAAGLPRRFGAFWRRYAYRVVDDLASVDPLRPGPRAGLAARARHCGDGGGVTAAARSARLRVVLQASRRRDHDPHAARPDWVRRDDGVIHAAVRADAFCHTMVRSLVGRLLAVGDGRRPPRGPRRC